jgi:hypothetical protein
MHSSLANNQYDNIININLHPITEALKKGSLDLKKTSHEIMLDFNTHIMHKLPYVLTFSILGVVGAGFIYKGVNQYLDANIEVEQEQRIMRNVGTYKVLLGLACLLGSWHSWRLR